MQNVGDEQLLMLLLVIEPDLEDAGDLGPHLGVGLLDQRPDCGIDMRAILGDLGGVRARDQAALGPRVARSGGDVVGIEQEGEAFVVDLVVRHVRLQQKGLEEPGRVRAMPFRRTRVRHRLDDLIFRRKRRGAALGLVAYAAEGLNPARALGLRIWSLGVGAGSGGGGRHDHLREAVGLCVGGHRRASNRKCRDCSAARFTAA